MLYTLARGIPERCTQASRFPSFLPIRLVQFTLKRPREAQNDPQNKPQNRPQNRPQMRLPAEAISGVVWGGFRGHFWDFSGPRFQVTFPSSLGNYVSKIQKLGKSRSSGQSRNRGIDRPTNRSIDRSTDRATDRQTTFQTLRKARKQKANKQTNKQINKQTNKTKQTQQTIV